jgi:RND family efflux transporter MFP subunit
MAARRLHFKTIVRMSGRIVGVLLAILLVAGLMMWSTGAFKKKITPGSQVVPAISKFHGTTAIAHLQTVPQTMRAVGTIKAIAPVQLTPRILGRIIFSRLIAGAVIHQGEVLVRLDDAQLKAQAAQAAAALLLAKAQLHQAIIDQRRDETLLATGDVTSAAMDLANTAVASDKANLARALAEQDSAKTVLSYAAIRSNINGIVMQKFVSVGDTVMPGQLLAKLYDPQQLQLAAVVRESLADSLRLGQKMPVRLEGLHATVHARIRQIVPQVSSQSRSFIVKATAHFPAGVWPGMYGQLLIPLKNQHVLVIPQDAIEHIGQLDMVTVFKHGQLIRQTVQPGRHLGQWREILSGLTAGQRVVVPPAKSEMSNVKSPVSESEISNFKSANLESCISLAGAGIKSPVSESEISNFKFSVSASEISNVKSSVSESEISNFKLPVANNGMSHAFARISASITRFARVPIAAHGGNRS